MISLKYIQISNFMSISSMEMNVNETQMSAITGANGAGKSALFDALNFTLSGYRRAEKAQDYVQAGTDCATIHLEAEYNGFPIIFDVNIPGPDSSSPTVKREVSYKDKVYRNSEYSMFLKENNLDDEVSLMFMIQGSSDIIDAKPSSRAETLQKLFNYEFNDQKNLFKEKIESLKSVDIETQSKIEELKNREFITKPLLRETVPAAIESWENRLKEIDDTLLSIGTISEKDFKECDTKIKSIQSEIQSISHNISSDESSIDRLNKNIEELKSCVESVNRSELENQLLSKKEELRVHTENYNLVKKSVEEFNSSLNILNHSLKELNGQIKISKTGVCHSCGQSIEPEYVTKLEEKKDNLEKEITEVQESIVKLNFDYKDEKSDKLKKNIKNIESSISKYDSDKEAITSNTKFLENLLKVLEERKDRLNKITSEKEFYLDKKNNLESLKESLNQKNILLEEKKSVNEKIRTARDNSIKNKERRESNLKITEEKKIRDERLTELLFKSNEVSLDLNVAKTCFDIFDKDFPNFIVTKACQKLSSFINNIIQTTFPYMKVKLIQSKSGVNFYYTSEESDDNWIPVSMASGAQRQVLSLAYKISLAKLNNVTTIFLDEIDASCSAENASIIYKFISSLTDFNQIFFISHRPESIQAMEESGRTDIVNYYVEKGEYSVI